MISEPMFFVLKRNEGFSCKHITNLNITICFSLPDLGQSIDTIKHSNSWKGLLSLITVCCQLVSGCVVWEFRVVLEFLCIRFHHRRSCQYQFIETWQLVAHKHSIAFFLSCQELIDPTQQSIQLGCFYKFDYNQRYPDLILSIWYERTFNALQG